MVPSIVFSAMLWASLAGVAVGATYLMVILVREWRDHELW